MSPTAQDLQARCLHLHCACESLSAAPTAPFHIKAQRLFTAQVPCRAPTWSVLGRRATAARFAASPHPLSRSLRAHSPQDALSASTMLVSRSLRLNWQKVICDPPTLLRQGQGKDEECIVVSVGSNGDASFERHVHLLAPHCRVDTHDGTLDLAAKAKVPAYVRLVEENFRADSWRTYVNTSANLLLNGQAGCSAPERATTPPS